MARQGQSSIETENKERGLFSAFEKNLRVFKHSRARYYTYFHFDLNSGSGYNEECGCIGSPIAFINATQSKSVCVDNIHAVFCDNDIKCYQTLQQHELVKDDTRFECVDIDNADFIYSIPDRIKTINPSYNLSKVIGSVLSDPNGSDVPIGALAWLAKVCPRIDILIHWNSNQFKRNKGAFGNDRPTLETALSTICKDQWLIRDFVGKYYWTILVGRNYLIKGEMEGFYDLKSPSGQSIYTRCNYTKKEISEFGLVLPSSSIHKQSMMLI